MGGAHLGYPLGMEFSAKIGCVALGWLMVLPSACATPEGSTPSTRLRLRGAQGPLDGFVQIPAGGNPGSTSNQRPELDEIGIHRSRATDFLLEHEGARTLFYASYRSSSETGRKTLEEDLTSNDADFAAGTQVASAFELNWYRLGIGRRYRLGSQARTSLIPLLEATLFDFAYTLKAVPQGNSDSAGRGFSHGDFRFGLRAEQEFARGTKLFATALIPLPLGLSTQANITTFEAGAAWQLPRFKGIASTLSLGISFDRVRLEDDQEVPNRIEVDFGPAIFVGLELGF